MTSKTYRTAQGKVVDLGALMLQNENTRAVGNMKVNARGDLVDGWNRPIDNRTQQVQKQYDRQVTNVKDDPVVTSATQPPPVTRAKPAKEPRATKVPAPTTETATESSSSGLAAAIARARDIQQPPLPTSKNRTGITRI
jgi:hypothetical protein